MRVAGLLPAVDAARCSAETFSQALLVATDFDGTVAATFEPSPTGIGVHEAHELAIVDLFGKEALSLYKQQGGLCNRAPSELVRDVLPDIDTPRELQAQTRRLVRGKLDILLDQIGTPMEGGGRWPRPVDGFIPAWRYFAAMRAGGLAVDTAIISSGHTEFITKTLAMWRQPQPDILVTDDTVSELDLPLPVEQRVKPAPLALRLVQLQWLGRYGIDGGQYQAVTARQARSRTLYVGDDVHKDGGMARAGGVEFRHISQTSPRMDWLKAELWAYRNRCVPDPDSSGTHV